MTDRRTQLEADLLAAADALMRHMNTAAASVPGKDFNVYIGRPDVVAKLAELDEADDQPSEDPDAPPLDRPV